MLRRRRGLSWRGRSKNQRCEASGDRWSETVGELQSIAGGRWIGECGVRYELGRHECQFQMIRHHCKAQLHVVTLSGWFHLLDAPLASVPHGLHRML